MLVIFVFMIGYVLLFVFVFVFFFFFLRLGRIGPWIWGFRFGPEVARQGLQGP